MKIAARRRLAVGVVATTSALMAGVLIAPASTAAANGLTITPNGVVNTQTVTMTFDGTDADFTFGGDATFTRIGSTASFTVPIDDASGDPTRDSDKGEGTFNFADTGNGLGVDGPADAGTYNVSADGTGDPTGAIAPGGNDTCTSCFTVLSPGQVAVTSVAPNSLRPNTSGNVSILGNNFERGTRIEMLFPDTDNVDTAINANQASTDGNGAAETSGITTRTNLKRRISVSAAAQAGARDVRVTNLDGNSARCEDCFFVAGAPITSLSTTSAFNDPTQGLTTITFTGTALASNGQPRLEFVGEPGSASRSQLAIPGQNVRDRTATSITADYDLRNAAPGGSAYQPFVQGDGGVVNACDTCRFTVIQRDSRTPTLTSLDRSTDSGIQKQLQAGTSATFAATGTNFSKGATLVFAPPAGLTVTGVEFVSPELLNVSISAANDTAVGDKDVTARLTDGKTSPVCDNCLVVTAAAATGSPTATSTSTASPTASSSSSATASPAPGARSDARYAGLASPVRVLDTRSRTDSRVTGERILDLSQRITDTSATTAVLNVTVTNPTARGYVVAYPTGTTRPGTSNVNFDANQTQANEVVVAMSSNRRVSLFVEDARAHVIVDLVGFFTTSTSADTGRVTTITPTRALDSRNTDQARRSGEVIVNVGGLLPSGATDAILNVTVQGPNARGFVVAYPTGTNRPATSNVNFERGQTQANEVVTRLGTGDNAGRVSLFIDSASTAIIVDVVAGVTPGTTAGSQVYTALQTPTRAADTRSNQGRPRSGAFDVPMPSTVPTNATSVVLNVTATNGTRSGFVTVYPAGTSNPGTSNVNFPGERPRTSTRPASAGTQANEVVTRLGNDRSVTVLVGGQSGTAAHVIVDVVGYFTATGAPAATGSPTATASATASCTPSTIPPRSCPAPSSTSTATASPSATASTTPRPTTTATATPTATSTVRPTGTATPTASAAATADDCGFIICP